MKFTPLLLAASLLGNAVLAGYLWLKASAPTAAPKSVAVAPALPRPKSGLDVAVLQSALAAGSADALTAAGCPPDVARALLLGRALDTFQGRVRALRPGDSPDGKYWRAFNEPDPRKAAASQLEIGKAIRDFSESLRTVVGLDLESLFNNSDARYAFLPNAKQEQLRRIERDYADMEAQIHAEEAGFPLPSDREKLKLLRAEKERDLAAALSPAERDQYAQRSSPSAERIRQQYGPAIQSEEQYRQIFALQKAFDDRYSNPESIPAGTAPADWRQARSTAELQLQNDIRAALAPDQWTALQRTNDPDVRTTEALARRLNLPESVSDSVIATRSTYSAQSLQINANAALSATERKTQLASLATRAEADLQAVLGSTGTQAYLQRSSWVNLLKNGNAFSTNPADAPGPVSPGVGTRVYAVPSTRPTPAVPAAPPRPRG